MPILQEAIHKLEVAGGMRHLKIGLAVLAVIAVIGLYNIQSFKNMSTQEAMDSAQLARNIAEGRGYTTWFVRPFSMFLIKRHNQSQNKSPDPAQGESRTNIKGMHPDIANPPVYPVALAGLMKVLPFNYPVDTTHAFWSR